MKFSILRMSKEAQNMVLQESITNSIPFHALAFHYILLCARGSSRHRSQRTLFSDLLALHTVSFHDLKKADWIDLWKTFHLNHIFELVRAKEGTLWCKVLYSMKPAKNGRKVSILFFCNTDFLQLVIIIFMLFSNQYSHA